ncbi:hypothetical protein [Cellulomonas sp. Root137]|uniref:hypothetical protein n=1 Tax=Cellulomonas sp. Root137 TaxID=1736459 RepID=UPI0006F759B3|nr:hypothetical protein [Cellulomonas sp. Root137]KQY47759.1 hypothetical protein ASD18_10855 [Cellulomonas sp. Root137]
MTSVPVERLWYVAYGSNLSASRFRHYLRGGRPPGSRRTYPGCRDRREPERIAALVIPGRLYFTGSSSTWGGGTAVLDPSGPGRVPAMAYLIRPGQLADVLAQEMRREPGTDLDLPELARAGHLRLGPGRYETVVRLGSLAGIPLLTLTTQRCDEAPLNRPSAAYLSTMAAGLRQGHGWDPGRIRSYLATIPGGGGTGPA